MTWKRHPVSQIFAHLDLRGQEFEDLADDIVSNGQRQPILMALDGDERKVADGWNRYRACLARDVVPKTVDWDGKGSLVELVFSLNVLRRHMSVEQRAMLAAEATHLAEIEDEARQRQLKGTQASPGTKGKTAEKLAKIAKVSTRTVERARKVVRTGVETLKAAVRTGKMPVAKAARIASLSDADQLAAMQREAVKVNRANRMEDARDCFDRWEKMASKLDRQMRATDFVTPKVLGLLAEFRKGLGRLAKKY